MKIALSVQDRLMLIDVLPEESNIVTLRLVREIREQVGFKDSELKRLKFRTVVVDGRARIDWDHKVKIEARVDFSDQAVEIIKSQLQELDGQKKLTEAHLALFDKFVIEA
jgi:hypothetical protein